MSAQPAPLISNLWCDDSVVTISDDVIFWSLLSVTFGITSVGIFLAVCFCRKPPNKSLASLESQRMYYAEWVGRWPFVNFVLMAGLMILLSGLAIFTKCGTLRPFEIDKETENYIKSDSPITQQVSADRARRIAIVFWNV